MHWSRDQRQREVVQAALERHAAVLASGDGVWQVGDAFHAAIEDGWLCLVATDEGDWPADDGQLLALNAEMGGCAKLVREGDDRVRLRGELRLGARPTASRLADRVAAMAAGFARARGLSTAGAAPAPQADRAWGERFADAGWPLLHTNEAGGLVDLEVSRGGFAQARVVVRDGGGVAVAVGLEPASGEVGRRAQQRFLLRASRWLRWVRPAEDPEPWLGVELEADAERFELTEALCALSVAYTLCASEHEVLGACEGVARAFLERGHRTTGRRAPAR